MEINTPVPAMPQTAAPSVSYAGFWTRFVAAIIDGILVGIVASIISSVLGFGISGSTQNSGVSGLLGLLYYVFMESSSYQATVGKMAMGIKVTDVSGNRIDWVKALIRYVSKFLSGIILMIGFIMVAFTEKKQGLHDMIASTLVVKK